MTEKLTWHTEKRKVASLVPYEHNPRKMTPEVRAHLERSLEEFDLVEIPAVNLDDTILAGHQRVLLLLALGRGEEEIDVRVPGRMLTPREVKRYNVASNAIKGDFIENILREQFGDVDLDDFGFNMTNADQVLETAHSHLDKGRAAAKAEPQFPIVPKFSEKHSALIIVIDNEIDANHIYELLGVSMGQCYKSTHTGTAKVVTSQVFIERWNRRR